MTPCGVDIINTAPNTANFPSACIVETLKISIQDLARRDSPNATLKEIMEQLSTIELTIRGRLAKLPHRFELE
jgi:hypothetical protein